MNFDHDGYRPVNNRDFLMSNLRLVICAALAATGLVFFSGNLQAETGVRECLLTPSNTCVDRLNTRLNDLETGMQNTSVQSLLKLRRVSALVFWRKFDLAEAIVNAIPTDARNTILKDSALVAIVSVSHEDPPGRARRLLAQIESAEYYEIARANYIANLARASDPETALQALAATNRPNKPLKYVAVGELSQGLALDGRLQEAVALIRNGTGNDEGREGSYLSFLVINELDQGRITNAEKLLTDIRDPFWKAIARSEIAGALAKTGKMAEAEKWFHQAQREMANLEQPDRRFRVFETFARSAVTGQRLDLAANAVGGVGNFPIDQATALSRIVEIAAGKVTQSEWRPIADRAISLLMKLEVSSEATRIRRDSGWSRLADAVAMAGDPKLAARLTKKISDKKWQDHNLAQIVRTSTHSSQFQEALDLLELQTDWDKRVQGYISLAQVAENSGHKDLAKESLVTAIGLIEGPEFVPVNETTISHLARYESRAGQYERAEMRLRHVKDKELQIRGRIFNLDMAATHGSKDDYDRYFAIAREAIETIESTDRQVLFLQILASQLISVGKTQPALEFGRSIEKGCARDRFLESTASLMVDHQLFSPAQKLISEISDPVKRAAQEHQMVLNALRLSLAR
ncbi:hypothetical protein [Sphingorhabdus sp. Alg231-15]|uniref:hypothetical protein n=1 Tax=Sphingorhabdus sp. Alg231-15 TaxID=1922222 RepID=UPI000D558715